MSLLHLARPSCPCRECVAMRDGEAASTRTVATGCLALAACAVSALHDYLGRRLLHSSFLPLISVPTLPITVTTSLLLLGLLFVFFLTRE